jgi:hypothetical protein
MAYTITKSGPYFSSGQIKFSDLRTYFKETSSGTLKTTELRRNTTTSSTGPIVPDCTENRTSGPLAGGISTLNDLKISQFRNSIKYYNVTQTGTNDNGANTALPGCNVSGDINWNSNLQYNIVKQFNVNGTIGSYSTSQYATSLNSATYNLYINVNGTVQGASGPGSSNQAARNGGNGGPAMYINPGTSGSVWVNVYSSGTILGGGGGGAMGIAGANGSAGTCVDQYETGSRCGGAPGCPSPYTAIGQRNTGCCASRCGSPCWSCCQQCRADGYTSTCNWTRTVGGAPGGRGGYGGRGIGYTLAQQNGFASPNYGEASGPVYGGCPTYGPRTAGDGLRGQNGGNGATAWGGGGNGTTSASGGSAGKGITSGGAGYIVNDTGYTSNIKGGY